MTNANTKRSWETEASTASTFTSTSPSALPGAAYDAVVVGAGPAGSVTAMGLAERGWSVALIDRATFPRSKVCGCCLNQHALSTLQTLGLADVTADAPVLDRFRLVVGGGGRLDLPLPPGRSLSRMVFDQRLIDHARRRGVHFLERTTARLEPLEPVAAPGSVAWPWRRLRLRQDREAADAEPREFLVMARVVVAADGLAGRLAADEPGMGVVTRADSRIGAGLVVDAATLGGAGPEPGQILMVLGRAGYVGLTLLEDGRVDLAAALDPQAVKRAGGVGRAVLTVLRAAGLAAPEELALAPWRGTPALTRRRRPWGRRIVAVGDAAGYVEPFTGEGMAWAVASAALVVPLLDEALRLSGYAGAAGGESDCWPAEVGPRWEALYHRLIGRRQRVCRVLSRVLRHPPAVAGVRRLAVRWPGTLRPLTQSLNHPTAPLASVAPPSGAAAASS